MRTAVASQRIRDSLEISSLAEDLVVPLALEWIVWVRYAARIARQGDSR